MTPEQFKDLIVVGSGGHARVVLDTATEAGFTVRGVIDLNFKQLGEDIMGCPVIGNFDALNECKPQRTGVALAIGDGEQRAVYYNKVQEMGFHLPNIIHPSARLSRHVRMGVAVFVNAGAIINARAEIGDNTIINTGAIVDHEVCVGRHSQIGPGARVGGRAIIADGVFVGIGANIIDRVRVGENATIGAGTVVIEDVEANSTVVGVPARRVR